MKPQKISQEKKKYVGVFNSGDHIQGSTYSNEKLSDPHWATDTQQWLAYSLKHTVQIKTLYGYHPLNLKG